ncbi:Zn-dependent exopeptidase [Coprinellus micaceus]|uniref:Peptide hydrolase n=1 Tax=Coprinellus micaceus TaxID=71717 RepID=A0A4Y7SET2_COPMI|nr:Zn-dependent exopeptidase [Coprinellus micaceus]
MKLSTSFIAVALAFSSAASASASEVQERGILDNLKPLVSSTGLQLLTTKLTLLAHARQFLKFSQLSDGTRAFGSKGHNATVNYIKTLLDATRYYDTELQTFPYLFSSGEATFAVDNSAVESQWFTYGPAGDITAQIVPVANLGCDAADYPAEVEGKIAFISRGTCEFGLKVALAGAAKAAGAIIYNNQPAAVNGGTLGAPERPEVGPYVPVASISGDSAKTILDQIAAGATLTGALHVDATTETRYTSNVIATTKGGDKNNIVFAGGHTDSVPAGPGINDDGSGTITILDIALRLPLFKVNNAVRFGFWTAEEFGLVGSEHYVTSLPAEEAQKIALYLNFDMVASPNYGYFIYDGDGSAFNLTGPAGSDHIEKTFEDFFKSKKVISAPTEFSGRSDYGPFLDVGIPAGGLFTGAEGKKTAEEAKWWGGEAGVDYDICYHKKCDDLSNLNTEAWVLNSKAAAHSIATYARSLNGIPRTKKASVANNRVAALSYDDRRHYSCGHKIESS